MKLYRKISKIALSIALFGLIFSSISVGTYSVQPKKAEAQWAVFDVPNTIQNTFTSLSTGLSAYSDASLELKEFVLDGVVSALAKSLIRNVTSSVVNWINSGFEGNPSFITNPGGFFANIGDELVGEFISSNGDLAFLCSPFSIDLRISLAFKYRPNVRNRMACTLSQVIANSKGAIENASINGFTQGDFRQGRWPAFIALTQEPQNNFYGAYIEADSILSARIGNKVAETNNDLNRGRGFLSWEECKDVPVAGDDNFVGPLPEGYESTNYASDFQGPLNVGEQRRTKKDCTTKTPGSVIAGALDTQLGIPSQELALADEFNEIINALFAQLVTQILNKGLSAVSGNGSGDLNSYINQLQAQNAQTNEQLIGLKSGLTNSVQPYLARAKDYQAQARQGFEALSAVNAKFEQARACYQSKLSPDYQPPLSEQNKERAQENLDKMLAYIEQNLSDELSEANALLNDGDRRVQQLEDILARANRATLVEEVNIASQQYASLLQAKALTSPQDIQRAIEKNQMYQATAQRISTEADIQIRDCQTFPQRR